MWERARETRGCREREAASAPGSARVPPAETLPAPELSAGALRPAPGASVQLRCPGPRAGLRFALMREDHGQRYVRSVLSPAGTEARFELRDVSVADSGNYSCAYVDTAPPFAGSAPSAPLELRVDGERPGPAGGAGCGREALGASHPWDSGGGGPTHASRLARFPRSPPAARFPARVLPPSPPSWSPERQVLGDLGEAPDQARV